MLAYQYIDLISFLDTLVSLLTAFILGAMIGYERQYRQRTAGLRTNVLVAVGAALFVDLGVRLHDIYGGTHGAVHVLAYVVSGIGFLGAGVIMREEGNIRGINTAATLWGSAAVGAAAGADLILEAVLGALFVLAANTVLRPVVNHINRQPIDTMAVEVTNSLVLLVPQKFQNEALRMLEMTLEHANYPIRDLEVSPFSADEIEIEATLLATSVEGEFLEKLVQRFNSSPYVNQAFRVASTSE
ncbi:MgtC/SapB family protein [Methylophaga lonarensis]|uniref:MgtC/SapB family protein n=1 Tax=Methylophaga lonarensis TaxID=999151 RepID=UPI003D2D5554